jgi:hypothetical protein
MRKQIAFAKHLVQKMHDSCEFFLIVKKKLKSWPYNPGNRSKNPLQNPSLNKIVKKFSTANLDSAGQVRPQNSPAVLDPNLIASGSGNA